MEFMFNPFPNNPWFLRPWDRRLLKTLREKEKMLVTNIFSFSHYVFYPLTFSQTTKFTLFQIKKKNFADDNFKLDKNGGKLNESVENTVGKREIARYEQFILFP